MNDSEDDVLAHMTFPQQHCARLHITNPLQRFNKNTKRRVDVVGSFAMEALIMRLFGAVLFGKHDKWQASSRLAGCDDAPCTSLTPDDGRVMARLLPKVPKTRTAAWLGRDRSIITWEVERTRWQDRDIPQTDEYRHMTARSYADRRRFRRRNLTRRPNLHVEVSCLLEIRRAGSGS